MTRAWAKRVRWTPVPDRFVPFRTNGKTHRGRHRLDEAGWYYVGELNQLRGPFDSQKQCAVAASEAKDSEDAEPYMPVARMLSR